MPCDYKKYPVNWKSEIRPRILERDGNRCKVCRVPNYAIGYRDAEGKFYSWELIEDALEDNGYDYFEHELKNCVDKNGQVKKATKIILTIMHLDHDTTNNDDSNLVAACQYHHLQFDKELHKKNSRKTINKKKLLQELF